MRRRREEQGEIGLGREVDRKKVAGGAMRGRELVCKKRRDEGEEWGGRSAEGREVRGESSR